METPRLTQVSGLFDLPIAQRSRMEWTVDLNLDRPWRIGLIVGASGTGKSTIARELWPKNLIEGFKWPADAVIIDGFPESAGIKDITGALCSVGFGSPPAWLRPYRCLSTGERFRADLARALVEAPSPVVFDEFTSVVDRTVAHSTSVALSKAIRRTADRQFIAVTCHMDLEDWLQPDWVYTPVDNMLTWRSLQRRPDIRLEIARVHSSAWRLFKQHHYLTGQIHRAAQCWVAFWEGIPVAFESGMAFMQHGSQQSYRREHRLVCLPDYQGLGIGLRFSEFIGACHRAVGFRWISRTAHPGLIQGRRRSPNWTVLSKWEMTTPDDVRNIRRGGYDRGGSGWIPMIPFRFAETSEYLGPPWPDVQEARALLTPAAAFKPHRGLPAGFG